MLNYYVKKCTSKSISEIARIAFVDRHTVRDVIQADERRVHRVLKKTGPKPKISGETLQMLLTHSQDYPSKSSMELRNYLEQKGILVSSQTVRRHLVLSR